MEYFELPVPDITEYDLDYDPHGMNAADYCEARKERRKRLAQMEDDTEVLCDETGQVKRRIDR